jgi:hypothetical protein
MREETMKITFVSFDDENSEHWYESLAEWQGGDYDLHQLLLEEEIYESAKRTTLDDRST